jgi:hypothetical protein
MHTYSLKAVGLERNCLALRKLLASALELKDTCGFSKSGRITSLVSITSYHFEIRDSSILSAICSNLLAEGNQVLIIGLNLFIIPCEMLVEVIELQA